MEILEIKKIIINLVKKLVEGDYDTIYEDDYFKRIPAEELRVAIEGYQVKITMPPNNFFDKIVIYTVSEEEVSIDFDLWCDGEQSDLTLTCRINQFNNLLRYSIEDIHVL